MWLGEFMKPLVLLIGGHDSGKSSIVSSLTGCLSRNFRGFVQDKSTKREIYVIASSPQEAKLSEEELEQRLDEVNRRRNVIGSVITIQPTRTRTRLSLEDIIRIAHSNTRISIFAFVLDPPFSRDGNVNIDDVRRRLDTLSVVTRYIDARRFAYLNASDIRSTVGIP